VVLPPGRDKLSTIPVPTASGTNTNTIGTVRVACCIALMLCGADVRMTSGASATSSVAYLRKRSASPAAHRTSMLTLRPTAQPTSCRPCRNAATRLCPSGSSAAKCMSTPMRRMRSRACCARAARDHAATAPPRSVMNSRRLRAGVGSPHPVQPVSRTLSLARRDWPVLWAILIGGQSARISGTSRSRTFSRGGYTAATTLAPAKGRLIRCTVSGSTPNRLAMTRTPGLPGVARASRIRFSSALLSHTAFQQ